jgi:hypothetical protein
MGLHSLAAVNSTATATVVNAAAAAAATTVDTAADGTAATAAAAAADTVLAVAVCVSLCVLCTTQQQLQRPVPAMLTAQRRHRCARWTLPIQDPAMTRQTQVLAQAATASASLKLPALAPLLLQPAATVSTTTLL